MPKYAPSVLRPMPVSGLGPDDNTKKGDCPAGPDVEKAWLPPPLTTILKYCSTFLGDCQAQNGLPDLF